MFPTSRGGRLNEPDAPDSNPTGAFSAVGETILRRFRVERVLGRGGMGEVLLAHDTVLNRRVALKRLRSDGTAGATRRLAALKEARRASQITDHRIAAIYDVLDLDEDVLIVMEYVDGTTLRARMDTPLPLTEFWGLASQCVEAVGAAHARGIIHRDIKPENLMVTGNGQIKILDFGIARRPDAPEGADPTLLTTMTTEGRAEVIAGTPQYMSPEAHYGGRLDPRTDIFSLGTVFYELLSGQNPFAGPSYQLVLERVMTVNPPPVSERNTEVGAALADVVGRMISKDPAHRQASCGEVLREMTAAQGDGASAKATAGASEAPAIVRPERWTRSRRAVTITVVLGAVAALAWAVWWTTIARSLPSDRNLAVLAPVTAGFSEEFANFAVGTIDLLSSRLQKHQETPGFQIAAFQDGLDAKVMSASDAHGLLGANLALVPTFEERAGTIRVRLDLWDARRGRIIASRSIATPVARPFEFLDIVNRDAVRMLGLTPQGGDSRAEHGILGAGTLSFLLQGIGRLRMATTLEQARRAVGDLELACRTEPDAVAARVWLAGAQRRCFLYSNDPTWLDQAEVSVREAINRDHASAQGFRNLGIVLSLKRDDSGAIRAFARACSLNPTDDDAHARLGGAYNRLRQPEQERDIYLSVIARRPHCWKPYWWLATWQWKQGRVEESIQTYRELVRRAPELYRGYANLGGLLVFNGDYDGAVDTLKLALTLHPTKTTFDNLGTAYFNSARAADAIDAYNQSIQFGFAAYDSWLNLGEAYYFLRNERVQAEKTYEHSIQLGRELIETRSKSGRSFNAEIPANMATVFPKLGEQDSARVYLKQALIADSTNMQVQYCAALVFWQLGERDRALAWLGRAVTTGYPRTWLRDSPVFNEWREQQAFQVLAGSAPVMSKEVASPN